MKSVHAVGVVSHQMGFLAWGGKCYLWLVTDVAKKKKGKTSM